MTTAQDRLNSILPSWYELLTQWSLDGSLVAAATEALVLDGSNAKPDAKGQLQSLVSQWSAGNFKSLPEIVLLSNEDISGAQGAYAASTGTIYLNQEWLLSTTEEEIQRVLTEELGHSLDAKLNLVDTKGDEGEFFANKFFRSDNSLSQYVQADQIEITVNDSSVLAEASIPSGSFVLQSKFLSNGNLYAIVNAQNYSFPSDDIFYKSPANAEASWMLAESYAKQLGGNLATIDSSQENEVIRSFIESYAASNALVQSFSSYQDIGAWIGLYFDRTSGQWSWSSTGQAADYINFAPSDSNTNGGDSDYVAMYSVDSWAPQDPGQWNDHENGMSIGVVEIPYTQYQDSAYVIVSGNTFEEARFNAQQLGGDLAILNSQAEFDFLVNTYQGYQAQWQSLWLGLTDAAEEGIWLNVDGTLAGYDFNGEQNYLPWHLAEPNDFQGEDYGVLNWSQYWAEQFALGREGVMHPAALNDINNFTATGYDKPIYGIAEIKLPQTADIIGTATSDATPIIISGDLTAPSVESYSTTTSGRGKKKLRWVLSQKLLLINQVLWMPWW